MSESWGQVTGDAERHELKFALSPPEMTPEQAYYISELERLSTPTDMDVVVGGACVARPRR